MYVVWGVNWFWSWSTIPACLSTLCEHGGKQSPLVANDKFHLWATWASQHRVTFRRLSSTPGIAASRTRIRDSNFSVSAHYAILWKLFLVLLLQSFSTWIPLSFLHVYVILLFVLFATEVTWQKHFYKVGFMAVQFWDYKYNTILTQQ